MQVLPQCWQERWEQLLQGCAPQQGLTALSPPFWGAVAPGAPGASSGRVLLLGIFLKKGKKGAEGCRGESQEITQIFV